MSGLANTFIDIVDAGNRKLGRFTMYAMFFALFGVLLYSSLSRVVFNVPPRWGIEMAQFLMVAYYLLAGGFTLQDDTHVRMDLLYGRWSERGRSLADAFTSFFLLTYLIILLYGGLSSTIYALEFGQRNYSSWAPYLWPIKAVMVFGIAMTLLQAVANLLRDVMALRTGRTT